MKCTLANSVKNKYPNIAINSSHGFRDKIDPVEDASSEGADNQCFGELVHQGEFVIGPFANVETSDDQSPDLHKEKTRER